MDNSIDKNALTPAMLQTIPSLVILLLHIDKDKFNQSYCRKCTGALMALHMGYEKDLKATLYGEGVIGIRWTEKTGFDMFRSDYCCGNPRKIAAKLSKKYLKRKALAEGQYILKDKYNI